jgi:hypothetical protein
MRVLRPSISLSVGFIVSAANAWAQGNDRIDITWFINDSEDPNDNNCGVEAEGTDFSAFGDAVGTGTDGDFVLITYFTPLPSAGKANSNTASAKQDKFSELCFLIESDVVGRNLDVCQNPEKCSVSGSVNANKAKGDVNTHCKGDDIYSIATADQIASIQTAFNDNKRVKIKVKSDQLKGSIDIKCKGDASED